MMAMNKKTGIYVPLITPFKEDGEVDYQGLGKATKFVLDKGVDGIYALGSTGEFPMLSTEERKRCLEIIIENAGEAEVIAHVGSTSTRESVELAKHAEKSGAKRLSAVAPYYFGFTFEEIKTYFKEIAHATNLPLMVYNSTQARAYSIEEMAEIMTDEKISSMKYTNANFYPLERLITQFPDKEFYTGMDEACLSGQAVGAHGAIGTTYNYAAEYYVELRQLYLSGDVQGALEIQRKVNTVTQALLNERLILPLTKHLMRIQGVDILPLSRKPFNVPTMEQLQKAETVYKQYLGMKK